MVYADSPDFAGGAVGGRSEQAGYLPAGEDRAPGLSAGESRWTAVKTS